jgi:DNA replication initiation complex subunit (GINS family)
MLLTFEKIREIQLNERNGELQKLPEGFFRDILEYLKLKSDSEEGKTAQKILINLFERRLKKIVNLSSIYYSTGRTPDNMDEKEQKLYSAFVSALKESDSEFRKKLYLIKTLELEKSESLEVPIKEPDSIGIKPISKDTAEQDGKSIVEDKEDSLEKTNEQKVKVKFIMDTPELMTPEMKTCSFKQGQCASLAKTFADFLEKRGFCSRIEPA